MDPALWVGKTGLDAHHRNIEIIANNLANATTTGFKKNRAEFQDLVYKVVKEPGSLTADSVNSPAGNVIGTGVAVVSNPKIFAQGPTIQTENPLDVAINGRGFIEVLDQNGQQYYTRAGTLQINQNNQLVTTNGYAVQPTITIPEGSSKLSISKDGIVEAYLNGATTQLGQLQLTDFINQAGLEPVGDNLYIISDSSGNPTTGTPMSNGLGDIRQGALEASNVNIVEEMVKLIEAQRSFEVVSKAVGTIGDMLKTLAAHFS